MAAPAESSLKNTTNTSPRIENTPAGSSLNPETIPEVIYLVYYTEMGETAKRVDRAYRTLEAATKYASRTIEAPGQHVKIDLWIFHNHIRLRCCVIQERRLNKEAPFGLDVRLNVDKSEPDVLYLVCVIRSGIVVQEPGPVYWERKSAVMQVCVDRKRAEELRWGYSCTKPVYPEDPVDSTVRYGQTLGVDVFRCRVHEEIEEKDVVEEGGW